MAQHRAPPPMTFSGKGDKTETYTLWKQGINIYSSTTAKTGEKLVPFILEALDDDGLKIFNTFDLTQDERKNPDAIFQKFEERLKISKPNFRAARLDLHFYYQRKDETLDEFYTKCNEKTAQCEVNPDEEKERILEQILASTPIPDFQKWLLSQKADVTIDAILETGRQYKTPLHNIQHIKDRSTNQVTFNAINKANKPYKSRCKCCGLDHPLGKSSCPARNGECHTCHIVGHWTNYCARYKHTTGNRNSRSQQRQHSLHRGKRYSSSNRRQHSRNACQHSSHSRINYGEYRRRTPTPQRHIDNVDYHYQE
ncbi:hypothetical protein SNE40_018935 [Patella caerulea]|uniref:Uncharacterized protein n=1 Tax=Patella caerulea TaxID=87958 RepID=A0AAN8J680_PATCE